MVYECRPHKCHAIFSLLDLLCFEDFLGRCIAHSHTTTMPLKMKRLADFDTYLTFGTKERPKGKPSRNVAFVIVKAAFPSSKVKLESSLSEYFMNFTEQSLLTENEGEFVYWHSNTVAKQKQMIYLNWVRDIIDECGGKDALGITKWGGCTSADPFVQVSLSFCACLPVHQLT
jgi:hypothetical protein